MRKPREYWTKERCQEESLKYTTKNKFKKNSIGAYGKSVKNKWINDICVHMKSPQKPSGYWNDKEKCKKESLKYNSRFEFQKGSISAYRSAQRNNWLDDICVHMVRLHKPNGYWTKDECHKEALKYKTRTVFYKNVGSAYKKAQDNGWLDDICDHMKIIGDKYKRCIYSYEFSDNHVYVGLTYNINNRHQRHMTENNSIVYIYMNKTGLKPIKNQLTKYVDVNDAIKLEKYYVNKYKTDSWDILNRTSTGSIGNSRKNNIKWTFEKCKEKSLKYNNRSEFQKYGDGAYKFSYDNNWLNEICNHMKPLKKPNGYWTKEKCKEEALKYNTKGQLKKNNASVYSISTRNKWLNNICSHMIPI